ncbi:hypothetical protein AVEN_131019-1, partial [Araneus ventricosus]
MTNAFEVQTGTAAAAGMSSKGIMHSQATRSETNVISA